MYSEALDDGVHGLGGEPILCGEPCSRPAKGMYVESGGGIAGAWSRKEFDLEGVESVDTTLDWYRRNDRALSRGPCKLFCPISSSSVVI